MVHPLEYNCKKRPCRFYVTGEKSSSFKSFSVHYQWNSKQDIKLFRFHAQANKIRYDMNKRHCNIWGNAWATQSRRRNTALPISKILEECFYKSKTHFCYQPLGRAEKLLDKLAKPDGSRHHHHHRKFIKLLRIMYNSYLGLTWETALV